jgi:K(+)-stimulated pyrophosphate-energized sodium pump
MNILIKLMSIVSLVIAPYIIGIGADAPVAVAGHDHAAMTEKKVEIKVMKDEKGGTIETAGLKLNIGTGENPIEMGLLQFIQSDQTVDKTTWFDFDRLTFETGKSTLKPESAEQLNNIAQILKTFPAASLKIGGYTDNVGKADANLKLSADRAKTVETELVKLGVAADRLDAEGYGDQYPVADNTTDLGRAKNRRISVRVTQK